MTLNYIGINYAEILSRKGLYGWAPSRPYIPGMEGSGIIERAGANVDPARIGQAVVVGTQSGCYAEKVVVPQERALPALVHLSPAENAAFAVNYMTAWVALMELANIQPGESVLITAAAGGVGTAAVQIAAHSDCRVYGMAGSLHKVARVMVCGAHDAFNYRQANAFADLRAVSGGVDVVLEVVGGQIFRDSFRALNPFGRIVVAGFASLDFRLWNPWSWWRTWRDIPRFGLTDMAEKTCGVMASHLGYLLDQPQRLHAIFGRLCAFMEHHDIRPVVGRIFPLEQAAEAHAFVESRESVGKVLLAVGEQ